MKVQKFDNHIRYYTPHHFIFYPLAFVFLGLSTIGALKNTDGSWIWGSICALWGMLIWLSFMTRQHYALTTQNRIVRLELRFRYFVLTGQRLEPLEQQLSFPQLAALRFASDEELPGLIKAAIGENLTSDQIKKSIKNWVADDMRV